jgi:hypothetical protein
MANTFLNIFTRNAADRLGGFRPGNTPGNNDAYDAYRHALVSAWLADRLGVDRSKEMMDKHEIDYPNPAIERSMDLWNNNVGRTEYLIWRQARDNGTTTDSLEKWIYDAVKNGKTINDPENPLGRQWTEPPVNSNAPDPYPQGDPFTGMPWPSAGLNIPFDVNTDYTAARGWTAPRDPLVLDLDGDGIETVGIDPLAPILFDHDADGVKTGTGWIQSDDGLLVIDVNGNGTIDSGRELFGDNSLLYTALDGPVYAADGYAALQIQDSNHDGVVNSLDANFNQLRVWRDLNQDGISQAGELQTLSQAGIASIGVTGTATNTNLGNGNTQVASGSFTRTNGTTGQSGVAELTASYLLAGNNRRYLFRSCSRNISMPKESNCVRKKC